MNEYFDTKKCIIVPFKVIPGRRKVAIAHIYSNFHALSTTSERNDDRIHTKLGDTLGDTKLIRGTQGRGHHGLRGAGKEDAPKLRGQEEDQTSCRRTQKGRWSPKKDIKRTFKRALALALALDRAKMAKTNFHIFEVSITCSIE